MSKALELIVQIRFAWHRTPDQYCPGHGVAIDQIRKRVQKVRMTLPLRQDGRHPHHQVIVGPTPFPAHATPIGEPAGEAIHIDTVVANDHTILAHSGCHQIVGDRARDGDNALCSSSQPANRGTRPHPAALVRNHRTARKSTREDRSSIHQQIVVGMNQIDVLLHHVSCQPQRQPSRNEESESVRGQH